jgi:hypothetical protein
MWSNETFGSFTYYFKCRIDWYYNLLDKRILVGNNTIERWLNHEGNYVHNIQTFNWHNQMDTHKGKMTLWDSL